MEISSELGNEVLSLIESVKKTGKIKKGINEVTKAIERDQAKLVVYAKDVNPPEIVMHLEPLCKEKGIPCVKYGTKAELGAVVGLNVGTSSIAIVDEGQEKQRLKVILDQLKALSK
ncbi:MAG: ribosomal L7Ae/L30e/S12e/Gadd45 family protein [Candidatus Woesearchaeota archaeon]